jgi:L-ribulokinase
MPYTLGLDFGTNSVRALVVDCGSGEEVGAAVVNYPSGHGGILLDKNDHHLARQYPGDYGFGLEKSVLTALAQAEVKENFSRFQVIGIGVDTTGSSPIPVDINNVPLALHEEWKDHLAAQCWLWKDHSSWESAASITELARRYRPHYVAKCGNTYSSEWFWSKLWHCLKTSPEVFEAAYSWVELCDYIPALLAGISDSKAVRRGICAAGHKALYSADWGGLPDKEFLGLFDLKLADLRDRLYDRAYDASGPSGHLGSAWAEKLGLKVGIPITMGAFDVHYGAIGSGVAEGVLVKVIGTSTCDCLVVKTEKPVADIPGICGIVPGSILPGYYGVEAGQSAVGDIFKWWVEVICQGNDDLHLKLTEEAERMRPGQSGLVALDWNNGNRTILVDPMLSGMILGCTLHSTRAEIYRALIEATAFGARTIIEHIKEYGVPVDRIVCAGGIAEKNTFLMQIYADITGCEMQVAGSSQACALGSAVVAAVIAGKAQGGHDSFADAQEAMTRLKPNLYRPDPNNQQRYNQLYSLYRQLHDSFGGINSRADMSSIMKNLNQLKKD